MAKLIDSTLQLKNCTMDYIAFGSGEKPLIMIPGLSLNRVKGSARAMSLSYRSFGKERRVYMFDTRSEMDEPLSIEQMADDLYEAMCLCNIFKADILGVSMGGMIGQALCAKHPETIHKAVIALSASRCTQMTEEKIKAWMSLAEKGDTDALIRSFFEDIYTENYLKKYRPFMGMLVKMAQKRDLSRFLKQAGGILSFDIREALEKTDVSAYVIGARKDRIVPYTESQYIASALHADCYIYEAYGHGAFEEAKDFNGRVLAALKEGNDA